jgi:alpha-galactosidase
MKLNLSKVILPLFFIIFAQELFAQSYFSLKDNTLTLNNGVISREIVFNKNDVGVLCSSFKLIENDDEFITHNSDEFCFKLDDKKTSGLDVWKLISSEEIADSTGGKGVKVFLRSDNSKLQIGISYVLYPNLPLIRKKIEFKNISEKEIKIESLDIERLHFGWSNSGTHCWVMHDYARQKSLGQFVSNWHDPVVIVHQADRSRGILLGNEAPGVMKRTTAFMEPELITSGLTHINQNFGFRKYIQPGKTWESTWVFTGLYNNSDNPNEILNTAVIDFVRRHLGCQIFKVKKMPVFVYNTWEPFRHDINEKMVYELVDAAAECGVEEFIIDDGWQDSYGDWGINKEKFPNGLKPVFDYIKSKGMKPGVWISIAAAESRSNVFKEHPEWTVRGKDGSPINVHADNNKMYQWETYSMCMTTGWKDYIKNVILKMVEEYGLEYIKADFATVTGAYTTIKTRSGCHAKDHSHTDRNESMLEMYQATWQLFDELHEEAPELFIDCTYETMGDIQLIDLDMCKHADGNWLSNFSQKAPFGALRVRQMGWWRTPSIPASAMVIGNQRLDDPNFMFSFKSLAGTLPIVLGDPRKLSSEKRKEIGDLANWLKAMQKKHDFMRFRQDLPGFGEPTEGQWDGFQRINTESKTGGIAGIFKQNSKSNEQWLTINYLDPGKNYIVKQAPSGKVIIEGTGTQLQNKGFKVFFEKEFKGELFEITELK